MILGYARVSTREQNLDGQRDALTAAGAERIFADTITGTARTRPELDRLMSELRSGDVVVGLCCKHICGLPCLGRF